MILYLGMGLIVSFVLCRKYSNIKILTFVFFLVLSGMGSSFNNQYRMGNLMLGDIGLFLCFVTNFAINLKSGATNKRTIYISMIAMLMLILGVLHGNDFGNIFRDIKVFLYFFVSYCYCSEIKESRCAVKCIMYACFFVAAFTLVTNLRSFLTVGIGNISSGKIDREFGLGLGAYYLVDVSVILFAARERIDKIIGRVNYLIIQTLLIVTCVVSYTRTVWIQLIIVYAFAIMLKTFSRKGFQFKNLLYFAGGAIVLLIIVNMLLNSDNEVVNLIMNRFTGIIDVAQNANDKSNTLAYRINDIKNNNDLYTSIQVVWGYGFGQVFHGTSGTVSAVAENSFLYYIIKYGLIGFSFLTYKVLTKLLRLFKTNYLVNKVMAVSLMFHMVIAAMSGNLNKYYSLPFIALALCIDFTIIFDDELKGINVI